MLPSNTKADEFDKVEQNYWKTSRGYCSKPTQTRVLQSLFLESIKSASFLVAASSLSG